MIDVERSEPAPESLESKTKYDGNDVKQRLLEDFLGKCWLTEEQLTIGSMEIDHFKPMSRFQDDKFRWDNLFPASHEANIRRSNEYPEGGLLDSSVGESVESRLLQWLDEQSNPKFAAASQSDIKATNTAILLNRLHNAHHPKAYDLRDAIKTYLATVLQKVLEYVEKKTEPDVERRELARLEAEIRALVSRNSSFTILIRSRLQNIQGIQSLFD